MQEDQANTKIILKNLNQELFDKLEHLNIKSISID